VRARQLEVRVRPWPGCFNSLDPELSVVVFAVFFSQAPRGVVMARFGRAFRAGLLVLEIEKPIEIELCSL